jgi:hypothetical protein
MRKPLLNKLLKFGLYILFLLLLSSCNGRPSGVLTDSEMTDVLTEMHKLDGALYEKGLMYNNDAVKDSYYNSVFKKYGISKAEFDSSLVWYTKNPKRFDQIYVDVMAQLTALDEDVKKGKFHPVDSVKLKHMKVNVWKIRTLYALTNDSARTKLNIEIVNDSFLVGDVYVLKFQQQIAKEDSCKNQRVVFRINYYTVKSDSLYVSAHNDNLTRNYTLRMKAKKKIKIKSLSVTLLGSSAYKGKLNATTKIFSLNREFNELKRDSLSKIIYRIDSAENAQKQKLFRDSLQRVETLRSKLFPNKLPHFKD